MKNLTLRCLSPLSFLAGMLLVSSVLPVRADDNWFYLQAQVGPAIAQNVDVKEFVGPVSNTKVKLDPGIHLGVVGGYNVNRWLSLEMETGIIANNIDRIGTDSPDASLSHVPFLVNAVLRYETENSRFIPYIGVGAGGDSSVLIVDDSLGVDGTDSDVVFACQGMAGLRFRISDSMSVGAGYKFFHAGNPSWHVRNAGGEIRFGKSNVHVFGAVFNWNF
jgi:opacity protein-like surface antigen